MLKSGFMTVGTIALRDPNLSPIGDNFFTEFYQTIFRLAGGNIDKAKVKAGQYGRKLAEKLASIGETRSLLSSVSQRELTTEETEVLTQGRFPASLIKANQGIDFSVSDSLSKFIRDSMNMNKIDELAISLITLFPRIVIKSVLPDQVRTLFDDNYDPNKLELVVAHRLSDVPTALIKMTREYSPNFVLAFNRFIELQKSMQKAKAS